MIYLKQIQIQLLISRVDLVKSVQINEGTEYFVDDYSNGYSTSTSAGENTYYDKIRVNKDNLVSIIGETGNFEILLENGTQLIQLTKDTVDDGDGYITINFGDNYFPEKEYKDVIYEEGKYESLVVTLGNGEGDNWWCVLFPPICTLEVEENKDIEYKFFVKEIFEKYLKR